ncbi:MAG TPA: M67 family metallopeptidase [Blastocatellia bacterium]|nr:M67 family metallopeptidase [Blastocatellia bacterium]
MAIKVKQHHLNQIKQHGERTYPQECCGLLLGRIEESANVLDEVFAVENVWEKSSDFLRDDIPRYRREESRQNRFLITPEQYKRADQYARERGLGVIGYYHSHPDHPAVPSGYDLDHSCWPGESYIIVSVENGKAAALNSFTKPDYEKFEQEEIIIE